jgi:diguanylate cyclase (GGDEF)-like protein/PAS domain S-box-containing protein
MIEAGLSTLELSLLDHVPIGMVALRADFTVVYWNSCLEDWTDITRAKIVGKDIREFFPHLQNPIYVGRLQGIFQGGPPVVLSSQLHKYIIPAPIRDGQLRTQHTVITAVPTRDPGEFFALFAIQDVSDLTLRAQQYRAMRDQALQEAQERQRAEEAEREQRVLAEALRDSSAALNTTLNLDEVLDRILANVGRVIAYGLVDILFVEDGQARVVRSQRQNKTGIGNSVLGLELSIADTPNLRLVAETKQPFIFPDTRAYPGWQRIATTEWIRSNIIAPILIRGQLAGFLGLSSDESNFFSTAQIAPLSAFANQAAIAIENARLYEQVQRVAITDELTGLYNRRGLFLWGEREIERAFRFERPLAAVMFDIDHFKQVNDQYGHPVGDRVLRALGECCREHLRAVDIVGRYGGEEFAIILPEADLVSATQIAERLRESIARVCVLDAGHNPICVTASLGVAVLTSQVKNLATLLDQADQAQYRAKQAGRNRVAVFESG